MSITLFAIVALVLHLAIAVILVRRYLRTRDIGFVWLGVAVVIWPLVSQLLEAGNKAMLDRLIHHQPIGLFPFSLVENGQVSLGSFVAALAFSKELIGVSLLLVAVIYLSRGHNYQSAS